MQYEIPALPYNMCEVIRQALRVHPRTLAVRARLQGRRNLPGSPPWTVCFVKRSDWSISRCMTGRVTLSFCLTRHLSDTVPRYLARSPGVGKQRLVTHPDSPPFFLTDVPYHLEGQRLSPNTAITQFMEKNHV